MAKQYEVEVHVEYCEKWTVEADTWEEAHSNWANGNNEVSKVMDSEVISVKEAEDE